MYFGNSRGYGSLLTNWAAVCNTRHILHWHWAKNGKIALSEHRLEVPWPDLDTLCCYFSWPKVRKGVFYLLFCGIDAKTFYDHKNGSKPSLATNVWILPFILVKNRFYTTPCDKTYWPCPAECGLCVRAPGPRCISGNPSRVGSGSSLSEIVFPLFVSCLKERVALRQQRINIARIKLEKEKLSRIWLAERKDF